MEKILVTGSNGLLGQKLIYGLIENGGFEILATARGAKRIKSDTGFTYQSLDITNREEVMATIEAFQPDVVINPAAMTNVDACETEKETCWEANVTSVEYLVEACEAVNARFVHLSTDFIFDGENGPYKEDDVANPLSYYAESKLASEKIVKASKLKWSIVRTIIIYGIVDDMSRSNAILWAKSNLEQGKPIKVVDDQFRMPTLAEDLAGACITIAERKAEGVYHISGKDMMSILELVYRVADYFDLDKSLVTPVKSDYFEQLADRPPKTGFFLDKAYKELDYKPHTFEEGIAILMSQLDSVKS